MAQPVRHGLIACCVALFCAAPTHAQKQGVVSSGHVHAEQGRLGRIGAVSAGSAVVSGGCWGGMGWFGGYPVFALPPIYTGPTIIATPAGFASQFPISWAGPFPPYAMPPSAFGPAALAPGWGPRGMAAGAEPPAADPRAAAREDLRSRQRMDELIKLGDRWFRAGQMRRAAERYQEAAQVRLDAALPHVRLAQVAIKRGEYDQAARALREAQVADPEWLDHVAGRDIQNLFGEPADFTVELGKLETRVQAEPEDRDAWLLLGTELFLTGRTERARDIFVRLTDRKPDELLQSLLDACDIAAEP